MSKKSPMIVIATTNRGKQREYADLFAGLPIQITWPKQIGLDIEVEENGQTFTDNALIKARAFCLASGLPALADDSGLEIDALHGAPGVYSARYAGPGADDVVRYRKVLDELRDVPVEQRTARFHCVIALVLPTGEETVADGVCEGRIAFEPSGTNGFGYDPIFYFPALRLTMAELSEEVKNRISHRARAVQRIRPALRQLFG